jgi:hypothetical protein
MKPLLSRAIMALAICALDRSRHQWSIAMRAEYEAAAGEGASLSFAFGCLVAAWREMLTREEGHFTLTSYGLALGLIVPMAAVQIGCALLGLPYLYPGHDGLPGALLFGGAQEHHMRSVYQAAIPIMAFLLLLLGIGQLCIAWAMLDRNWARVTRIFMLTLAAAATLIIFMSALFIDSSQALLQAAVQLIELATIWMIARWHASLCPAAPAEHPG